MENIEFHAIKKLNVKNPTLVVGFPGTGLVGSIAASQLVDSLSLEFVGYISSPAFAPLAAIHEYRPLPAARIHYSEKHNLVVVLSEMSIPVNSSMELADKLYDFAKTIKAKSIISLGGISLKESEQDVYFVSSDDTTSKTMLAKRYAKPIREGATTGVIGILLTKGVLEEYPVLSLLAESSQDYIDPRAAANALRTLSKILGLEISTGRLEKDAKQLAKSIAEVSDKSKARKTGSDIPSAPSGGMYG